MNEAGNAWKSAPVALGIVNGELLLIEANARLLRLLGHEQDTPLGQPLVELLGGDEEVASRLRTAFEGRHVGPVAVSFRKRPLVFTCWPVAGGEAAMAMACYEPAAVGLDHPGAHERFRLLATAVEKNPDAIFIKDTAGRHLLVNPACADLIGKPAEEILGRDLGDLFPTEIAQRMLALDRKLLDDELPVTMEEWLPHAGLGEKRIYLSRKLPYRDDQGRLIGLIGFGRDVTETRLAELAVRQSESKFRSLVEQATDAFFLHDAKGSLLDVNEEACHSLGYSRNELLTMNVSDVDVTFPTERIEREFPFLKDLPATLEGVHRRKDGSTFPVEVRIGWFEAGGQRQLLALARDITDRKEAEQELKMAQQDLEKRVRDRTRDLEEANEKLTGEVDQRRRAEQELRDSQDTLAQQRQQLELLAGGLLELQEADRRRLAGELHDDLTQRLAALSIEAGRLPGANGDLPATVVESLEAITRQCVDLSVDIHRMARRLHPSILDDLGVVDAIRAECESFQDRHGIELSCEMDSLPDPFPQTVALCLYRVVQESLTNVGRHAQAEHVHLRLGFADDRVVLTVADDGQGFASDTAQQGLGLISMQERVRRLDGTFRIDSAPDKGTTVRMALPVGE